jgi:hypothetical protein
MDGDASRSPASVRRSLDRPPSFDASALASASTASVLPEGSSEPQPTTKPMITAQRIFPRMELELSQDRAQQNHHRAKAFEHSNHAHRPGPGRQNRRFAGPHA